MILPIRSKSSKIGKWSTNWGGPYRIEEVIPENYYVVQSVQETSLPWALNRKYLKRYYPSVWQDTLLEMVNNEIIVLITKMAYETLWTSPSGQIWCKCLLIRKFN
jgi:hypothetical protein